MREVLKRFGKYRGVVVDNNDPMRLGRLHVSVPVVSDDLLGWAMPCMPWTGPQTGLVALPPAGSSVWVEFEQGDPDRPIWVGGFWPDAAEMPAIAQVIPPFVSSLVAQTATGNALVLSDMPGPFGGVMLRSPSGAAIVVNDSGIYIQNGKGASIVLMGPAVSINGGALSIT